MRTSKMWGKIIFLIFTYIISFVTNSVSTSSPINTSTNDVNTTVKNEGSLFNDTVNGCHCLNYSCGCCGHLEEEKVYLNATEFSHRNFSNETKLKMKITVLTALPLYLVETLLKSEQQPRSKENKSWGFTLGSVVKKEEFSIKEMDPSNMGEGAVFRRIDYGALTLTHYFTGAVLLQGNQFTVIPYFEVCINAKLLRTEYGISITMTFNNITLYNETVSARNPPPICIGAPYLKEFAELCVRLFDLDITRKRFHGCADAEVRLKHIILAEYQLGCFDIRHFQSLQNSQENINNSFFVPSVTLV